MNENKTVAVVFDFDNTLADTRAEEHLIDRADRMFRAFHERTSFCPPVATIMALAQQAKAEGKAVVICTARRRCWEFTLTEWFLANMLDVDAIYMRADDDDREDDQMKLDLFKAIDESFIVEKFYDDRGCNIRAARAHGWNAEKVLLPPLGIAA